jgi:hypothetical protein
MSLYQKMQTSSRLETEGIWLHIEDNRIRLARAGGKNTKFIAAAEKIAREHKRAMDFMGEAQGRKIFGKLYAEIIVLDWLIQNNEGTIDEMGNPAGEDTAPEDRYVRGVPSPDGTVIDFNVQNIVQVFDDIPDLLRIVKETAEDASLFRKDLVKHIEGN